MPENKIKNALYDLIGAVLGDAKLEDLATELFEKYKTKVDELSDSMAVGLRRHSHADCGNACEAMGWAETAHVMAEGAARGKHTGKPIPPMDRDEMALMLCAAINTIGHMKIAAEQHDSGQHRA